jgi:hypothetical protein
MPLRRMSSTFSTPACPLAARPHRCATDHHRAPKRSLDDVLPGGCHRAPPPSRPPPHDRRRNGRRRVVEVVATVIGHGDGADADIDGALGVVGPHHSLEHERAVPLLDEPGNVVPGRWRCLHPLAVGGEERRPGHLATTLGTPRSGRLLSGPAP